MRTTHYVSIGAEEEVVPLDEAVVLLREADEEQEVIDEKRIEY